MKMGFIGAGKVGTSLALYFLKHNIIVQGFFSKSYTSAQKSSKLTNTKAFNQISDLINSCDMIWLTVSDDKIESVANQLLLSNIITNKHIIIHTSGVHSSELLKCLLPIGCSIYSIHPMQAFADPIESAKKLYNTGFTIEGSSNHIDKVKSLFQITNNKYFVITKEAKALYHAGACIISNYLVTLFDIGINFFNEAGLDENIIVELIMPLIHSTIDNVSLLGTKKALTGPITRGDISTLSKHLEAINNYMPNYDSFYKLMILETLKLADINLTKKQAITTLCSKK